MKLEIKNIETGVVVRSVDVSKMSERMIDRTERGMLINMNREKYYVSRNDGENGSK